MNDQSLFASNTLSEHLLRGAVGAGALVWAIRIGADLPLASLALGRVTLIALRGCPVCWTVGLLETASRTLAARTRARDQAANAASLPGTNV